MRAKVSRYVAGNSVMNAFQPSWLIWESGGEQTSFAVGDIDVLRLGEWRVGTSSGTPSLEIGQRAVMLVGTEHNHREGRWCVWIEVEFTALRAGHPQRVWLELVIHLVDGRFKGGSFSVLSDGPPPYAVRAS